MAGPDRLVLPLRESRVVVVVDRPDPPPIPPQNRPRRIRGGVIHHHNVEYRSGLFEYRIQAAAYVTLAVIGDNRHAYLGVRLYFQGRYAKDPRKTRFNYTEVTGNRNNFEEKYFCKYFRYRCSGNGLVAGLWDGSLRCPGIR